MRVFTTLLATLASLAVVSATTDAADTLPAHVDLAAVASPGEDIPSADSNSFVVGQRSLEKRTLCAKDSDCNLVAHVLPLLYPNGAQCVKWLCVPKCGDLWDWDIFSHKCRDVSSDNENWCAVFTSPSLAIRRRKLTLSPFPCAIQRQVWSKVRA